MAGNDGGARGSFRPRSWEPERPATRPGVVWTIAILMVVIGLLGAALNGYLLEDALSHGEEDRVVVLLVAGVAVGIAQVASGFLIFYGVNWGRGLAVVACGLNLAGGLINAVNDTGSLPWVGIIVNIALIGTVMGKDVAGWCR